MNEENENQPAPVETESASPDQRHHRPRRRFPRRRYRGDRFRRDNSEESPNSSSTNADNDVAVETLDQPTPGGAREAEGASETSEPVQTEPEFGEGIIEISGKGFGFLRDPNAILCRQLKTSLSLPKLCVASLCATACGS